MPRKVRMSGRILFNDRDELRRQAVGMAHVLKGKVRISTKGSWVTVIIYTKNRTIIRVKAQGFYNAEKALNREYEKIVRARGWRKR